MPSEYYEVKGKDEFYLTELMRDRGIPSEASVEYYDWATKEWKPVIELLDSNLLKLRAEWTRSEEFEPKKFKAKNLMLWIASHFPEVAGIMILLMIIGVVISTIVNG